MCVSGGGGGGGNWGGGEAGGGDGGSLGLHLSPADQKKTPRADR